MKKIKRGISIILVVVMVGVLSVQGIWAKNLNVVPKVTYVLDGNEVIETLIFVDTDGILVEMQTRVFPNGNAIFNTTKRGVTTTKYLHGRDYETLYQITSNEFNGDIHIPQTRGSEISGS